jgi:hypothetical protein
MFFGSRSCVVIGPEGQNPEVVAHELMHAELADRVGSRRRITAIPVWFDEGIAMQVDFRPQFDLPESEARGGTSYVRQLEARGQFFDQDPQRLTRNFRAAKAEVAQWLSLAGQRSLYERLEQIRAGRPFQDVVAGR